METRDAVCQAGLNRSAWNARKKNPELTSSDHIEQRAALNWMCHGLVATSRHSTDTIKGARIIHKGRVGVRRKRKL